MSSESPAFLRPSKGPRGLPSVGVCDREGSPEVVAFKGAKEKGEHAVSHLTARLFAHSPPGQTPKLEVVFQFSSSCFKSSRPYAPNIPPDDICFPPQCTRPTQPSDSMFHTVDGCESMLHNEMKPWEIWVGWDLRGNCYPRVSWAVQDFVHQPQGPN